MFRGLRNVIFHRGPSVTRTIWLTAKSKADISNVIFIDPQVYAKQSEKRKEATSTVMKYGVNSGLDAAGAETAELAGPAHRDGNGKDKFPRYTAVILDKKGQRMYFYRKSDGEFFERVHIPTECPENEGIWKRTDDYVQISKDKFDKKEPPEEFMKKDPKEAPKEAPKK